MKIGDKLFCKKTINDDITIGEFYIIDDIWSEMGIIIITDTTNNIYLAISTNEYNLIYKYIGEYFHTIKEIRKLKIESI